MTSKGSGSDSPKLEAALAGDGSLGVRFWVESPRVSRQETAECDYLWRERASP